MTNTNTKYAVLTISYYSCSGGENRSSNITGIFDKLKDAQNYIKAEIENWKTCMYHYNSEEACKRYLSISKHHVEWNGRDPMYYSYKIQKIAA